MNSPKIFGVIVLCGLICGCADRPPERGQAVHSDEFINEFPVKKSELTATSENPLFPMRPGMAATLTHDGERLTITVLPQTVEVDGVTAGILEEREEKDGELVEISRNYFATDPITRNVYYFGEDVDNFSHGKVVNHNSAWLSGRNGAKHGLMMPGEPRAGQKFYQEVAPGVALDRVEIVSVDATVATPAGTFTNCVHLVETTPLEPGKSHKFFAPGIGIIKDDEFELAKKP